jgi:hypothetical protein
MPVLVTGIPATRGGMTGVGCAATLLIAAE